MVTIVAAMASYITIASLVYPWEGRQCWLDGSNYQRLSLAASMGGAVHAFASELSGMDLSLSLFLIAVQAGAIWPVLTVAISSSWNLVAAGFLTLALPSAFIAFDYVNNGIEPFCDGHGDSALGAFAIQTLVLIVGVVVFSISLVCRPRTLARRRG